MNIVLEIGLNADVKRGIDYYTENMILGLAQADPRNRYLIFSYFFRDHDRKTARLPDPRAANFERYVARFPDSVVERWDVRAGLPIVDRFLLRGREFSVYHMLSGGRLPHVSRAKTVVTFFDLMDETHPATGAPDPGRRIAAPLTYDRATRADHVIATGDTAKKDLMRFYGLPDAKITVLPTGVDLTRFRPVEDRAERDRIRARYHLPSRFVMAIGPFVPPMRTNSEYVLQAYAALSREGRARDCRLVFVGSASAHLNDLLSLAENLGLKDRVSTTGYVDIDDLAGIYSMADAVVHPTSVTGFGYGLEPLACGTPFITSDLPGVQESVGGVALCVPPQDVEAIKGALERVISDSYCREEMRRKGLARAAAYSYPAIAARLVSVYERLAAVA